MSTVVTVTAPPIRVAIWAKGISCIRLAAVRMATSPVPPCPLWHAAFEVGVRIVRPVLARCENDPREAA